MFEEPKRHLSARPTDIRFQSRCFLFGGFKFVHRLYEKQGMAMAGHLSAITLRQKVNDGMYLAESVANRMQRLSRLPTVPTLTLYIAESLVRLLAVICTTCD
jgi:hypothetical protein